MIRFWLKLLSLMTCAMYLAGCASIVSGGLQAIPINSNPTDAKLEITDLSNGQSLLNTKTPFTATLKRDSGYFQKAQYKIKVSKDGHIPQEKIITADINGWYIGNIVFGSLLGFLIVDPATGAMWKLNDDPINMILYPDTTEGKISMDKAKVEEYAKNGYYSH